MTTMQVTFRGKVLGHAQAEIWEIDNLVGLMLRGPLDEDGISEAYVSPDETVTLKNLHNGREKIAIVSYIKLKKDGSLETFVISADNWQFLNDSEIASRQATSR